MRRRLIAGNWKMNGQRAEGRALAQAVVDRAKNVPSDRDLLVCPPATLLGEIAAIIAVGRVALGAQDCAIEERGAFTGEVSAEMIADLGCSFVIVGHSERRQFQGETDAIVAKKTVRAQAAGLNAIVCVGETAEQRDNGKALDVVGGQLAVSLSHDCDPKALVVAYEPVWAIGSGETAKPDDIEEIHRQIVSEVRSFEKENFLGVFYGGSVDSSSSRQILSLKGVQGLLIGGASLECEEFCNIVLNNNRN